MMAGKHLGVAIRDYFIVAGYFGKWMVAVDEMHNYYVVEDDMHLYEAGSVCDAEMQLLPAHELPDEQYKAFKEEFMEVG